MKGHSSTWHVLMHLAGIIIGIVLILHGWGGNELSSSFVLLLGIIISVIGIVSFVT